MNLIQLLVAKSDAYVAQLSTSITSNETRMLSIVATVNTFLFWYRIRHSSVGKVTVTMCTEYISCTHTVKATCMNRQNPAITIKELVTTPCGASDASAHLIHNSNQPSSRYTKIGLIRAPRRARPARQPVAQHPPCTGGSF